MSMPLILWCVIALFATVPTAFSRPRHIGKSVSEVKAGEVQKRQAECGNPSNNGLKSPGYPSNYPNSMNCIYSVEIPAGRAMNITFNYFRLKDASSCGYDYLKIANEKNETFGGSNGKYCGRRFGNVLVTGRFAVFTFHSDSSVTSGGYHLTFTFVPTGSANGTQAPPTVYTTNPPWYTTAPPNGNGTQVPPTVYTTNRPWYTPAPPQVGCGYVQNRQLASPRYPNFYPNGMDCTYWVYIFRGWTLRIYFRDFEVESHSSCGFDYLKITNERNVTFGKYCGVKTGRTVFVTGRYAVITFHSDGSFSRRGYKLIFSYVNSGSTQGPPTGHPTNPPWFTTAPPNGTQVPPTVYTTNRPWYTTAPPQVGCGYVQNRQLASPRYPNFYPNGMDCTYWVYIPRGWTLRIYFRDFDVESHSSCGYDYLRITNERNVTFGKFCGVKTGRTLSVTGRYAVITFHSDSSVSRRGYKLLFSYVNSGSTQRPPTGHPTNPPWFTTAPPNGTQVPPTVYTTNRPWYTPAPPQVGCGYVQNRQLASPRYPNSYPNGMDCTYWVYIPRGWTLRIYFRDFDVESHSSCGFDYLKITNERNVTFGKFCGVKTGRTVSVTGRYAVITFHSDGSVSRRGYKLIFSYVNSVFTTPRPSSVYPTAVTAFPSIGPSPDAKSKLQYLIHGFRYLLNQMEYVVNNEVPSNSSVYVREYKAQVQRAVTDVHDALQAEGRQKRDVGSLEMISKLEKKADDLITRLQIKEDHPDGIKITANTKMKGDAGRDISVEKENEPGLF